MNLKIKKLNPEAVIPTYAKFGDAGMDITAISVNYENPDYIEYKTGLSFELPENHVMLIFPRSSNSKYDLLLCNSVGVLDSGYRGELLVRFKRIFNTTLPSQKTYNVGDKVAQLIIIPYPQINLIEVDELSNSERGDCGFGSTGK